MKFKKDPKEMVRVQVEMTKYYGFIAIILISLLRMYVHPSQDWSPMVAHYIFPFCSLKVYNKWITFIIAVVS